MLRISSLRDKTILPRKRTASKLEMVCRHESWSRAGKTTRNHNMLMSSHVLNIRQHTIQPIGESPIEKECGHKDGAGHHRPT